MTVTLAALASLVVWLPAAEAQTASSGDHASSSATADGEARTLRAGDRVRLTVWRRPELSGEFRVTEEGTLEHPLYRTVGVRDVPVEALHERLRTYLRELEADPQLVVQPLFRVFVGGAVRQPRVYHLPPETTVADAVAEAGGPLETGDMEKVDLLRSGAELRVDLTDPEERLAGLPVRSGDEIVVERRGDFNFFQDLFLPVVGIGGSIASIYNIVTR